MPENNSREIYMMSQITDARKQLRAFKIYRACAYVLNAFKLRCTGPMNIQFIAKDQEIKVIEANVRASRSFPFVSKALDVNLIELATMAMMDIPFTPYPNADVPPPDYVCVKVPQFSFSRLQGADPILVCFHPLVGFLGSTSRSHSRMFSPPCADSFGATSRSHMYPPLGWLPWLYVFDFCFSFGVAVEFRVSIPMLV